MANNLECELETVTQIFLLLISYQVELLWKRAHPPSSNHYDLFVVDINECIGVNNCQQGCNNTLGSFLCSCEDGFTLNADESTCDRKYTSQSIRIQERVPAIQWLSLVAGSTYAVGA
jgi:hypothetical protein